MNEQEREQALKMELIERDLTLKMELTKIAIKESYLKTLREELRKLAESPETIERINRYAPLLAEAHSVGMIEQIKRAYNRQMDEIKRESKRLRLMVLLPLSIVFGLMTFYSFWVGHLLQGVGFFIGSVALLVAFVLGLIRK